jgi:CxxC motif-containing protein (DUF1111 family)
MSIARVLRRITVLAVLTAGLPLQAGPFTVDIKTRDAFGQPFPSLTIEKRREFFVGNSFFRQAWVRAPATTTQRDGLGPTFNATSCSACHQLDGRGIGTAKEGLAHVSVLFRLEGAEETYGGQLNPFALDGVPGEGKAMISSQKVPGTFADGTSFILRQPVVTLTDWMFGAPRGHTRVSSRVGQQLIGLGLLERIPAFEIETQADPADTDGDGISGRPNYVLNLRTGKMDLGRFGWKSEQPTVEQQTAGALIGDMGLTSELFPQENCPAPQLACQNAINGGTPEVDARVLARMTHYIQTLAVPAQRAPNSPEVTAGRELFTRIGCASCHTPTYSIDGIEIHPYTDMLLHDMGPGLSDTDLNGIPLATEWRTPPLWGIGLFQTVNRHQFLLHDGRADGVAEAILWHGGEAERAKESFRSLSQTERANLIKFVESL